MKTNIDNIKNKVEYYNKYFVFLVLGILLMVILISVVNAQENVIDNAQETAINSQENVIEDATKDPGIKPDSFLWGLDKALDNIALLLTFDKSEKAKKGLEIAYERLLEVRAMVEENKLEKAELAREEHEKTLVKVKENIKGIKKDKSLEEIEKVIEIEKEVDKHNEKIEQISNKLKVKIKINGEITQQQKDLIDSILNLLEGQTGEIEIEIKNKKDKIKIKIKQETGRSDEEIENEIGNIEKEKGVKKQEKALEEIEEAEEEYNEFLEKAKEKNIIVSQDLLNQFNSLLEKAKSEYEKGNYMEAKKLGKKAGKLLEDNDEDDDEDDDNEEDEDNEKEDNRDEDDNEDKDDKNDKSHSGTNRKKSIEGKE